MPEPAHLSPPASVERLDAPHLVVFSSLFPSSRQPNAGPFVRERMFRVGRRLPLSVVSPVPWFPMQSLLRTWRPHFRPGAPAHEVQSGFDVWFPRFFSAPGLFKHLDGHFMAKGAWPRLAALRRAGRLDIIDAHFGYPDGYAATRIGKRLDVPVTITLRGTEARHAADPKLRPLLLEALQSASRIFAVAGSLKQVAVDLGIHPDKIEVVGNGVDADLFAPIDRRTAREALGIPAQARVLISVGGLVERKGFHRVIEILPALRQRWPDLHYLIVGGPSAEGDNSAELRAQVDGLGLQDCVDFLGTMPPAELHRPLSAADVFVLATRNEGWANVLLEAMACGLPVVTTDVGGNCEVVATPELGIVIPFGDEHALLQALEQALQHDWDGSRIRLYAKKQSWSARVIQLCDIFEQLHGAGDTLRECMCDGGTCRT